MTLTTKSGRALLEFWRMHRTAMHAVPYDYADAIEDDILAIEQEARAEQAAEVERLRAALEDCSALLPRLRSYILSGEPVNALDEADILGALMAARAALAPVAPAPAEPRP